MTPAEKKLWVVLRGHRLDGIAFRRQMPIAGFIVDFAASSHKLIVELDGSQHGEADGVDADRLWNARLAELGWRVLRFWNRDVLDELDGVCRKIPDTCGTGDAA
jgi:very-short-patch-repair endonuclease